MKSFVSLLCAALLVLTLAACGGKESLRSQPESRPSPASEVSREPSSSAPSDPPADKTAPDETTPAETAPDQSAQDEIALPQLGRSGVARDLTPEQQRAYFIKYIQPYYIAGLMNGSWSDPKENDVRCYMNFYIFNESDHYWGENPISDAHAIPANIVEDYITSYFEVDPNYLRTAENYDPAAGCYRSMFTEGIGGGPGVVIERIEKDEFTWKFVCGEGAEGNRQASVTIEEQKMGKFRYIAGEGLADPGPSATQRLNGIDLGAHANALTEQLITTAFEKQGESYSLDDKKMTHFAMGVVLHLGDEGYQYRDIVYREDGYYHFQAQALKRMMWEVFGLEDWEPDKENWRISMPIENNSETGEYVTDLAFDFSNLVEPKIMATAVDTQEGTVIVDYDLYTSSLYPDPKKIAAMSTHYFIRFREDDTPYLRYEGTYIG